eukprot:1157313-Pelagomonas_calceolata.AAC.1
MVWVSRSVVSKWCGRGCAGRPTWFTSLLQEFVLLQSFRSLLFACICLQAAEASAAAGHLDKVDLCMLAHICAHLHAYMHRQNVDL